MSEELKTQPPYTTHTNVDALDRMWRPALAFLLAIGWIVGIAMGNEVPVAYQAIAAGGIAGLGVDRALWKRKKGEELVEKDTTTPSE